MMTLSRAAEWCGGALRGPAGAGDAGDAGGVTMTGATIDTRKLKPGDLFVALPGTNTHGRDFLQAAAKGGAAAALVDKHDSGIALPQIVVSDPAAALGNLARRWRRALPALDVVAVTGTNGKTTTREMIASILRDRPSFAHLDADPVLTPSGNFNNLLGVPLTLLRLRESHQVAVLELGMNRPGEIATLAEMVRPAVAVITNAGRGHLAELKTVGAVAREKGAVLQALPRNGVAILNRDDPHFDLWREMAWGRKVFRFALAADGKTAEMDWPGLAGDAPPLRIDAFASRAWTMNSMAALLAAMALYPEDAAKLKLRVKGDGAFAGVAGRLDKLSGAGGAVVIDDSYNANPDSVLAALDAMKRTGEKDKCAALADMLELGCESDALHEEVGEEFGKAGIVLFGFGDSMKRAVAAAERAGGKAKHFADKQALVAALKERDKPDSIILVKGSRGMKMEEVVRELTGSKTDSGSDNGSDSGSDSDNGSDVRSDSDSDSGSDSDSDAGGSR